MKENIILFNKSITYELFKIETYQIIRNLNLGMPHSASV